MERQLMVSRLAFCALAAVLLALAVWQRKHVSRILRTFFTEEGEALNLAVFRIVLFATLFRFSNLDRLLWFSELPESLRILPWGSRWWLFGVLPITATWAMTAWVALRVASFAAMLGLWTRISATAAAFLAIYVLGIPQLFGKVHHYHHLVWFAAILAASRCGDALSCDALFAAWRRADQGRIDPPGPSRAYALPLRFVWLLMGLIYFFPGVWKWWTSGIGWAWSENLKLHLYAKWAELNGWMPAWRIDQHPLVYRLAGLGTLVFELGFLWCLFAPRLRLGLAVAGLAFHKGTKRFMRIGFESLQVCYVTFVNWAGVLRRLGTWLFRAPMCIVYDGNCRLCRRTIALLRVFDVFGQVRYVSALDEAALAAHGLQELDRHALLTDLHAVLGTQRWLGYAAYRALAWRLPLVWPVLPLLYVWPITAMGRRTYRHVADARSCELAARPQTSPALQPTPTWAGTRTVIAVGVFLIVGNVAFGIRGLSSAWPLACYPTFRRAAKPQFSTVQIVVVDAAGVTRLLDDHIMERQATIGRWKHMLGSILSPEAEGNRRERLAALWELWVRADPSLRDVKTVRFYKVTRSTSPAEAEAAPVHEELLWEATV